MVKQLFTLTLLLGIISLTAKGQIERSAFKSTGRAGVATTFATDYQTLSINPANLGWKPDNGKNISIGFMEGAYSIYSQALTKQQLRNDITDFSGESLNYSGKIRAAEDFANEGFQIDADVTWLGGAFQNETIGGIGFRINERAQWSSEFNGTVSAILFRGFNADYFDQRNVSQGDTTGVSQNPQLFSNLFDGSEIKFNWIREYNLSYGRKIASFGDIELFGGIGLKYIQGIGHIRMKVDGNSLKAYSATSPALDIDYGDAASQNPSAIKKGDGAIPKSVGNGFGLDIGINAQFKEKLKVGLAVNDIGSVTWDGNVYELNDTRLKTLQDDGFDSYNIINEVQEITSDSGLFKWDGEKERQTQLPTNVRLGASYEIIEDFLHVGTDLVLPGNDAPGNFGNAMWAIGGDIQPLPWFKFSTGFITGGNYRTNIPVGAQFILAGGTYEMGIASRDAVTFFRDNGPTLSLSTGFLRFRF